MRQFQHVSTILTGWRVLLFYFS